MKKALIAIPLFCSGMAELTLAQGSAHVVRSALADRSDISQLVLKCDYYRDHDFRKELLGALYAGSEIQTTGFIAKSGDFVGALINMVAVGANLLHLTLSSVTEVEDSRVVSFASAYQHLAAALTMRDFTIQSHQI